MLSYLIEKRLEFIWKYVRTSHIRTNDQDPQKYQCSVKLRRPQLHKRSSAKDGLLDEIVSSNNDTQKLKTLLFYLMQRFSTFSFWHFSLVICVIYVVIIVPEARRTI